MGRGHRAGATQALGFWLWALGWSKPQA